MYPITERYNDFSGDLPSWLGNLKRLRSPNLSNNDFSGIVPESIGDLLGLEHLNILDNHRLSGCTPRSWNSFRLRADHHLEPCEQGETP